MICTTSKNIVIHSFIKQPFLISICSSHSLRIGDMAINRLEIPGLHRMYNSEQLQHIFCVIISNEYIHIYVCECVSICIHVFII